MCVVVYCRGRRISDWSEITFFLSWFVLQSAVSEQTPVQPGTDTLCIFITHRRVLNPRLWSSLPYLHSQHPPSLKTKLLFFVSLATLCCQCSLHNSSQWGVCGFFLFFASFLTLQLAEQFLFPYFLFFIFWTENITWWEWIQFSHTS